MLVLRRQLRTFCAGSFLTAKAAIVTLAGVGSFVSGLVALVPGVIVH